jgi:hypothetical protein
MPPDKTRRLATASSRFAGPQWLPPAGAPARPGAPANASAIDIHSAPTALERAARDQLQSGLDDQVKGHFPDGGESGTMLLRDQLPCRLKPSSSWAENLRIADHVRPAAKPAR